MLRHRRADEAALRGKKQLKDLLKLAKELNSKQLNNHLTEHVQRIRKYTTHINKMFVSIPSHVNKQILSMAPICESASFLESDLVKDQKAAINHLHH